MGAKRARAPKVRERGRNGGVWEPGGAMMRFGAVSGVRRGPSMAGPPLDRAAGGVRGTGRALGRP